MTPDVEIPAVSAVVSQVADTTGPQATNTTGSALFQPLRLRELTLRNRVVVSPMQMYSAHDGVVGDWHLMHLGRFALGGASLVVVEATAVCPEGRSTLHDNGLWNEDQVAAYRRITGFLRANGAERRAQASDSDQVRSRWRRAMRALPFSRTFPECRKTTSPT